MNVYNPRARTRCITGENALPKFLNVEYLLSLCMQFDIPFGKTCTQNITVCLNKGYFTNLFAAKVTLSNLIFVSLDHF